MNTFRNTAAYGCVSRRDVLRLACGASAAAVLNSRALFAQATKGALKPVSIDMHAHWVPQAFAKETARLGHPTDGTPNPLNFDLKKRVQWMDEHGVQMHVLTLSGQMPWQWASPADGAKLAQIANDNAVEAHAAFPTRFVAGIELPVRDPKIALAELNRMAGKPGMRAVHAPNSFESKDYLFDAAYEPLLARIEQLGLPLLFHPLDGEINFYSRARMSDPLSGKTNFANTLGFPFETATTAARFIATGTLDKFPKLEIVLPHSGGTFPYIAGRIEHGLTRKKFDLKRPFRDYIRRFHYDTLTYYPETLRFMITLVGADRVVIGTDNYAAMDVEYPNALVEGLKLPAPDQDKILRGNAKRLLGI